MTHVAIPPWDDTGVLPPLDEANPTSPHRSPYLVSLTDVVLRFGTSQERCRIIDGFLKYRGALHAAGLTVGFQWLNGSFLEHVEWLEFRAPNDVDVVTFYQLPPGESPRDLLTRHPDLFPVNRLARREFKSRFRVDAYVVNLATPAIRLVERSTYWYSLWSHRRNQMWKGYVQIDLAPTEDSAAGVALAGLESQGVPL